MKTSELIAALHAADPTGELDVAIDNLAIVAVEAVPAFHDGCLQSFIRAEDGSIREGVVSSEGDKVRLISYSLQQAILDDPTLPVRYVGEYAYQHTSLMVHYWKKEAERITGKARVNPSIDVV